MRNVLALIFLLAVILCMPVTGQAAKVEVYAVMEEEMSPMELRSLALAEGFAMAVTEEAQAMLGGALDTVRMEAMKQYFVDYAKSYIQGYNILSSEDVEDGLLMNLDVRVNRRTLRDGLKQMGFFETVKGVLPVSASWPEDVTEEETAKLQQLMTMFGLEAAEGVLPVFTLERGQEETYKGRLQMDDKEWTSVNKDMAVVWTTLWKRYFSRIEANVVAPEAQYLSINGWFSPDGVLEFDRVLKAWDSAVQDSTLVEMDIQTTGVGATWDVHILDSKRLSMLLNSFLPQRGLSFQLNRDSDE